MSGCRTIKFLYDLLPLKIWRGYLIRRHIEKCAACERQLAPDEGVRALLIKEEEAGDSGRLWPGIRAKLQLDVEKGKLPHPSARVRWRWALATASLMIAVLAGLWLFRGYKPDRVLSTSESGGKFQIQDMKIGNEPARPFVYQPQDSKIIIIWAEKTITGG